MNEYVVLGHSKKKEKNENGRRNGKNANTRNFYNSFYELNGDSWMQRAGTGVQLHLQWCDWHARRHSVGTLFTWNMIKMRWIRIICISLVSCAFFHTFEACSCSGYQMQFAICALKSATRIFPAFAFIYPLPCTRVWFRYFFLFFAFAIFCVSLELHWVGCQMAQRSHFPLAVFT